MKNSEYWKKRFELLEQSQNQLGVRCYADIEKQYRQAQKQIEGQLLAWYQRFAKNNNVTIQDARKMLTGKELEEFKWDVNQYIQYGQENAINGMWVKQLENASARYHISRLEALKIQTQQALEVMFGNQLDSIDSAMRDIYTNGYYHTAFEIQKGVGVGWNFATLDEKRISKVINKPWSADGKNFSQRIWENRQKLVNELNTELTRNIILGQDPQKAIDAIAKKMKVSKSNAGALVMTEEAFFSSAAQRDSFNELDVEQFEVVATLDSHTSDICQGMDGKHFSMSQWEVGVTAPPFHVRCRTTTVPYFDDDFGSVGERAAKGEDGKTYYVPANMKYKDWKKAFVDGDKTKLTEKVNGSNIKVEGDDVSLEYQRYGRNKETTINHTYINSGEYRNKFDRITNNINVNRILYAKAKEMLNHRSGTKYEDMYWVDAITGEVLASALNEQKESGIQYTKAILQAISENSNVIAFHTHPSSMPPSVADFNSTLRHGYAVAFVVCHDGKIIQYVAEEEISERLYSLYIQEFISNGYTEYEAQWKALEKLKENYKIDFWEVLP